MKEMLLARIDLLSLREKLYIICAILAGLWMGIDNLYPRDFKMQDLEPENYR